jgi:arylformamidase
MNRWIDISVPIRPGMHEWPGDHPFELEPLAQIERGDQFTFSRVSMTWHVGTHMDAPGHAVRDGARIDAFPPDAGIGAARVNADAGVDGRAARRGAVRQHRSGLTRHEPLGAPLADDVGLAGGNRPALGAEQPAAG